MKLSQAILLVPPGYYLKCGREKNEGIEFPSACLFQECPDEGWENPRHDADRYADKVLVGVTADETDYESFERLVVAMIVERFGTNRQKDEIRAALDNKSTMVSDDVAQRTRDSW